MSVTFLFTGTKISRKIETYKETELYFYPIPIFFMDLQKYPD